MQIAQPALSAFGETYLLSVLGQIGDDFAGLGITEHGADRHAHDHIVGGLAVTLRAAAVLAFFGLENARVAKLDQRIDIAIRDRKHAAATSAVAAVWAALGNVFFATKRRAAVATLAGVDFNFCFVDEFHIRTLQTKKPHPTDRAFRKDS